MSNKSFLTSLLSLFSKVPKTTNSEASELHAKVEALKISMISYMKKAKPSYSKKDVDKCASILNNYLDELAGTNSKEEGMEVVKSTVLKLNILNDSFDGELIETSEREDIAEIIVIAGSKKGYNSIDEDITEEWREW